MGTDLIYNVLGATIANRCFKRYRDAGIAAQASDIFRDWLGDYHLIFLIAAVMGFIATQLTLRISVRRA